MSQIPKNSKLSQLLLVIPNHVVITSKWLKELAYSYSNIERYKASGWLQQLARGVYKKQDDDIDWRGALFGLQQQHPGEHHAGGLTSLELRGSSHFTKLGTERAIYVYSSTRSKLPLWFRKVNWGSEITFVYSDFLDSRIGIELFDCGSYRMEISSRERAMLEMIYGIPKLHSFAECNLIMENLSTLRPELVQELLMACKSVKVLRVFLFLAKNNYHKWFENLELKKLDLGEGKRQISARGIYDPEFKITYPKDLFEDDEIRF